MRWIYYQIEKILMILTVCHYQHLLHPAFRRMRKGNVFTPDCPTTGSTPTHWSLVIPGRGILPCAVIWPVQSPMLGLVWGKGEPLFPKGQGHNLPPPPQQDGGNTPRTRELVLATQRRYTSCGNTGGLSCWEMHLGQSANGLCCSTYCCGLFEYESIGADGWQAGLEKPEQSAELSWVTLYWFSPVCRKGTICHFDYKRNICICVCGKQSLWQIWFCSHQFAWWIVRV